MAGPDTPSVPPPSAYTRPRGLPQDPGGAAQFGTMTTRTEHAVVIVGAGPTGLMLAGELALANVDVGIVERRPSQALDGWRAGGLLPRTLEVLDQRGIVDRFVSEGQQHPVVMFPGITLNISDLPTRHPYWLALWQEPRGDTGACGDANSRRAARR